MKNSFWKITGAISFVLLAAVSKAQTGSSAFANASIVSPVAIMIDTEVVQAAERQVIVQIKLDASDHELYSVSLPEELELIELKSQSAMTIQIVKKAAGYDVFKTNAPEVNAPTSSDIYPDEETRRDSYSNAITVNFN